MKKMLPILAALALALSCNSLHKVAETASELFGDEVVARVGDHKLHESELRSYIPAGVTSEDSLSLAQQYIQSWAKDLIILDMADKQLSDSQKDVSRELEEYRRTLIRYRYEQLYINERLDTLISESEIRDYYEAHPEKFKLERPIMKARFMIIQPGSPSLKTIRKKMSSSDVEDVIEADSLAMSSAIRYLDRSEDWMDALTLAQEFGTDYVSMLSSQRNSFIELTDPSGNLRIAYIVETVREGKTAPLDFCRERIRDIILNSRKHTLASSLEQDLLSEARSNGTFIVYEPDEKE